MASSGSTKDLSKTLTAFLQAPSLPLPPDVLAVIAAYLHKHGKLDEAISDRVHEELLGLYDKNVQNRPDRYGPFLAILRELRPALRTPHRIFEWWDKLLDPVLEHVDREKGLAQEVLDNTLDLLSIDDGNNAAGWKETGLDPFINRLLSRWLEFRKEQANTMSSLSVLKEGMILRALLAFGKKDPRAFMTALDAYVVKRESRNNAFSLLCDFVDSQPPHLHMILQTPLFGNILQSLQHDESTSTVNVALLSIIMLLPYMPSSLVPFLPTLFNIYARLAFWDMDFAKEHTELGPENGGSRPGMSWEKALLDPDYDGRSIEYLPGYFTILYGLYPINFVDYIRKPQRYLRHANNADNINVQAMEIRDRSERFREMHRLHPNFYNLTIESEKTDFSRWISSEADEVLADCMALLIRTVREPEEPEELAQPPGVDLDLAATDSIDPEGSDMPLLSRTDLSDTPASRETPSIRSARRGSHSSHPSGVDPVETKSQLAAGDSPTLPPHLVPSPHPQSQDTMPSSQGTKPGLDQTHANDSVPSLALSPQEAGLERRTSQALRLQPPASPGDSSAVVDNGHVALLYHQNMRLLNDLRFERYIKQQHMTHMGELRRKQIREAATEAETQNLVMANRSLKQRLDEAKRQEVKNKKEFDHRLTMWQKREQDVSGKVRTLREQEKKLVAEDMALRQELETRTEECKQLRAMMLEAEQRRLQSEQDLEAVDLGVEEIARLKADVARLSAVEHEYMGRERSMDQAVREAEAVGHVSEELRRELEERERQLSQMQQEYNHRIAVLEDRLAEAVKSGQQGRASEAAAAMEESHASSRAKLAQSKQQYIGAMEKFIALQMRYDELQMNNEELQTQLARLQRELGELYLATGKSKARVDGPVGDVASAVPVVGPATPIPIHRHGQRMLSDAEPFEAVSHNATSPLEPINSPVGSGGHSSGGHHDGRADRPGTSTSPQLERYLGRGGVQNAKKDRKDKKDDKGDKKDKKSRGIRF